MWLVQQSKRWRRLDQRVHFMLPVLGKSAIEVLVRHEGWAWEGVSSLGALEAVEVVEELQYGAPHHLVHGLAFSQGQKHGIRTV